MLGSLGSDDEEYLKVYGYLYRSGVLSPLMWVVISMVTRLIALLITAHEPPSRHGDGPGNC